MYSRKQCCRLYDKAYARMDRYLGPGGKQYGIDFPTLWMIAPKWAATLKLIIKMWREAKD